MRGCGGVPQEEGVRGRGGVPQEEGVRGRGGVPQEEGVRGRGGVPQEEGGVVGVFPQSNPKRKIKVGKKVRNAEKN